MEIQAKIVKLRESKLGTLLGTRLTSRVEVVA